MHDSAAFSASKLTCPQKRYTLPFDFYFPRPLTSSGNSNLSFLLVHHGSSGAEVLDITWHSAISGDVRALF